MNEKIKERWGRMLKETQSMAIIELMKLSGSTSTTSIKQNWIWGGGTPEEHQENVLGIFDRLLEEQEEKTKGIINA